MKWLDRVLPWRVARREIETQLYCLREDVGAIQDALGAQRIANFLRIIEYRRDVPIPPPPPMPIDIPDLEKRVEALEGHDQG